jgi:hypothetical protein
VTNTCLVPVENVLSRIFVLRGVRVVLDRDLATLYSVSTRRLNEQVRRNPRKFPEDFMFQLTGGEKSEVVAKCDRLRSLKFSPVLPHAFTEHGAIQAANILNSDAATDSRGAYDKICSDYNLTTTAFVLKHAPLAIARSS